MIILVSVLVLFSLVLIVVSRHVSALQVVGIIGKTVLVAVASWIIWSVLLMRGVVQVEPLLEELGVYRLDQPWAMLLFLMPPVIVAVVFGWVVTRRVQRGRGKDGGHGS